MLVSPQLPYNRVSLLTCRLHFGIETEAVAFRMQRGDLIAQQQAPVAGLLPLCQLKVLYAFIPNGRTWIKVVTDEIDHRHRCTCLH